MDNQFIKLSGVAALVLAVLFPVYWILGLASWSFDEAAIIDDFLTLDGWDFLFVVIGALEIGVYLALRKFLSNQFDSAIYSILLIIMSVLVGLFHLTVVVDVLLALGPFESIQDEMMGTAITLGLVVLYLYAIVALFLAIALLARFTMLPVLMKLFAVGLLVSAVFQLTVVLAPVNVVIFPALLIILAIEFLRGEQVVEVV
ncbi:MULTISPECIES: hypothetical protein [Gammaproteobacteria]|uniref:hypothetical protein n=1 Tax=Gammaproteobacteria TaxID=1236 RepID=UPI000DD00998|nr:MULTISPECIES: hypothetical protein [Gammaproteobacteria]RTE85850.1 hypothetical protein DQX04_10400 [Aliidiomarina sp. B3213]TCZ90150.1 hypothetical protein EYQ95_10060 [Lysobacter sp. N42]